MFCCREVLGCCFALARFTELLLSGLSAVELYFEIIRLKKLFGVSLGFVRKSMYGLCANCVTVGEESKVPYFFSSLFGVVFASLSTGLLSFSKRSLL